MCWIESRCGLGAGLILVACVLSGNACPQAGEAARRAIDVHEHIDSMEQAKILIGAMDRNGIAKTVLLGSSRFTFRLYEWVGFTGYDENNDLILQIAKEYPGRFLAWPTVDPRDPAKLAKFRALHARGASGLKLYVGHGYRTRFTDRYMFHTVALDDPGLLPLYAYCAEHFLPACIHVNPDMPGFADELVCVLKQFPDLKVNVPHWMLSSIRRDRLRELLDVFPNLYTDISFGHDDYLLDGLRRVSGDCEDFRDLIEEFPQRFFFGTDFVFTDLRPRDAAWLDPRIQVYYDLLSKKTYATPLLPGPDLNGLALAPELVENILHKNFERFMELRPKDTKPEREIDWDEMEVEHVPRKPGEALPPPPWWNR